MTANKTPKQVLLEFYAQYPDAQKPTFQVIEIPGAQPHENVQYRCTVVCPGVCRGPGDQAFEDVLFEGAGKSKKAAEHDCADKAYAYIRTVPGLKLPSGSLSLGSQIASPQPGAAQPAYVTLAASTMPAGSSLGGQVLPNPMAAAPAGPVYGAGAGYDGNPLGLTINDSMIEGMTPDQLKSALRELLGLYKNLVQGVHGENQRHHAELHSLVMRQL